MVRTASTPTSRCAAHGSPTWQSPNEGEHRALQVPPEDGQPLLQLCRAHFTLAFGAIDHQGGSILLYGDGHHMLLAVTDLDLHQGQGDILRSQDDQLQGRSTPEHTAVRAVQPRDLPLCVPCPGLEAHWPLPCPKTSLGAGVSCRPGGITGSHRHRAASAGSKCTHPSGQPGPAAWGAHAGRHTHASDTTGQKHTLTTEQRQCDRQRP